MLIAGCGYVGSRLAEQLVEDGASVVGLRRSRSALPRGVEPLAADLTDPSGLAGLPDRLDAVVYAAGPTDHDETGYRHAYVDGLGNLLEALGSRAAELRRLIFVSSTAVYGQSDGAWVDEASPTEPRGFAGRVLLEAEALVREVPAGCVLRLGGIYGPGRTWLVDRVRTGAARRRPGPPHYTNRIHRDDAAGALRHLLRLDRTEAVYLGVDGNPGEESEVLRFLAQRLGVAEPPLAGADEPAPRRRAGSKRCRNDRLVRSGYTFRYPSFREGYEALLGG